MANLYTRIFPSFLSFILFISLITTFIGCKKSGEDPETPEVIRLFPSSGKSGMSLLIVGRNFSSTASNNKVTFGDLEATVTSASSNQIEVVAPNISDDAIVKVKIGGVTSVENHIFYNIDTSEICNYFEDLEITEVSIGGIEGNKRYFSFTLKNSGSEIIDLTRASLNIYGSDQNTTDLDKIYYLSGYTNVAIISDKLVLEEDESVTTETYAAYNSSDEYLILRLMSTDGAANACQSSTDRYLVKKINP